MCIENSGVYVNNRSIGHVTIRAEQIASVWSVSVQVECKIKRNDRKSANKMFETAVRRQKV